MIADISVFAAGIYFLLLLESHFITALSALMYFKCAKTAARKIDVRDKKFDLKDNYIICILVSVIGIVIAFYSLRAAEVYTGFQTLLIGAVRIFMPKYFTRIRSVKDAEDRKCVRLVFSVQKLNILFSPCVLKQYDKAARTGFLIILVCAAAEAILQRMS
ncbi:hypothetical protein H0R92_01375 [Treponema sp. OMZ 840]|uniref:hypothetical protein n=1 Tax=Treponema sp. OMZ 840 TaxID=244313 RepID=UPI003D8D5C65